MTKYELLTSMTRFEWEMFGAYMGTVVILGAWYVAWLYTDGEDEKQEK